MMQFYHSTFWAFILKSSGLILLPPVITDAKPSVRVLTIMLCTLLQKRLSLRGVWKIGCWQTKLKLSALGSRRSFHGVKTSVVRRGEK
ncbi:hypothetical protein AMEX_G2709 [Astyanax mexicanus]|uniref:Secreted protein n=1 Tax=Astyanax mexicanus TaxID=7994 RepID=A0A8T2MIJ9_ASTMX|nr:hypothetical protein AMEX_G2709 [Astyanax mexicanus]